MVGSPFFAPMEAIDVGPLAQLLSFCAKKLYWHSFRTLAFLFLRQEALLAQFPDAGFPLFAPRSPIGAVFGRWLSSFCAKKPYWRSFRTLAPLFLRQEALLAQFPDAGSPLFAPRSSIGAVSLGHLLSFYANKKGPKLVL
jgi:hypothetical protein